MTTQILHDYSVCGDPKRRHDFILLFDVKYGNPNGDPDADNLPRIDDETNHGLVTDVCLKRKVRNFVSLSHPTNDEFYKKPPILEEEKYVNEFGIYIQDRGFYLNDLNRMAHEALRIPPAKSKTPERADRDKARELMCAKYYDIRTFGAVMSTGVNCGQVRGPIQMTFACSADPIYQKENLISRVALTDEKEKEKTQKESATKEVGETEEDSERLGRTGTFGRKPIVPYGLYIGNGFFSAPFAEQSGVTRTDLELFWKALQQMWDHDHSAARGQMACQGLYIFSHADGMGNAPAHSLFNRFSALLKPNIGIPRAFSDYGISLDEDKMPEGVTLTKLVQG